MSEINLQGLMQGVVVSGYRVASGLAADCPWAGGSVARQLPLMAAQGLDTRNLFCGTLNVALNSKEVCYPDNFDFDFVIDWRAPDKPTQFRLHPLQVAFGQQRYQGWSYRKIYPVGYILLHAQPDNVIEIMAPRIEGIQYGDSVKIGFINHE